MYCSRACKTKRATQVRRERRQVERQSAAALRDAGVAAPVPARDVDRAAERLDTSTTALEATVYALDLPTSRALIAASRSQRHGLTAHQLSRGIELALARQKRLLMAARESSEPLAHADVSALIHRCDDVFEMARELSELAGVAPPALPRRLHHTPDLDALVDVVDVTDQV